MTRKPKYQQVFDAIKEAILSGRYEPGQKLPSEANLLDEFATSRITIIRALRDLQQRGLVQRRVGSGTYVADGVRAGASLLFGLLIPNLGETEIFGPICQGMAESCQRRNHALLWGDTTPSEEGKEFQTLELCRQYVAKKVAGVFFAPLERTPQNDRINEAAVAVLEEAGIPIVLLDRNFLSYPNGSPYDLVAIDHRRAGFMATEHLLKLGCKCIAFVAYTQSASTVEARIAGYREALFFWRAPAEPSLVWRLSADDASDLGHMVAGQEPQAIVCANDRTAGQVMHTLMERDYRIPNDVRIVGIDDVQYASLLPVPLTTVHQPCREIGVAAVVAMLERITSPETPRRDILLDCKLVVRESCGASL
ncbi:MAG: GntR family transcriptional regulator [Verrucomicrobia bacterium]|nr:GntR family transcriptional regulator [Verrucomicrobiota bacterium]MBV9642969.1 GntR family transcriptional regulator [Verrucomicrobiota bacterium]